MRLKGYFRTLGAIALLLCSRLPIDAAEPIPIDGGISPNSKVAVVVKADEDTSQDSVSAGNDQPYLENVTTKKIIGPLEEVNTTGGGFGHVLENVTAYWSPDSRFVAVRYRAGRLSEDFVIYQIERHFGGYRAVPEKLPDATIGSDGEKVFAGASHAANMGDIFDRWLSPTEFTVIKYRFFPPDPPTPYSGYFDGDGRIEIHYSNHAGTWIVSGYATPPALGTAALPLPIEVSSATREVSAKIRYIDPPHFDLTVRDSAQHILFEKQEILPEAIATATWTDNGHFLVLMTKKGSNYEAWIFSMQEQALRKLGEFYPREAVSNGGSAMTFYHLNEPTNPYVGSASVDPVVLQIDEEWKKLK